MENVLVVVDMQNDFINGSLGTSEAQQIVENVAKKINKRQGHVKPGFKTKAFFNIARMLHKKGLMSSADHNYWKENGWFGKARPWK